MTITTGRGRSLRTSSCERGAKPLGKRWSRNVEHDLSVRTPTDHNIA
jgi:hypothetical protein